jgi:hypothetical protein
MAQTPETFLSKNMKYFAIAFLILFLFKSMQSCNRSMQLNISTTKYNYTVDSLKYKCKLQDDSIKNLNFKLQLSKEHAQSADEKANAIQSAVETLKSNTTITIKGVEK